MEIGRLKTHFSNPAPPPAQIAPASSPEATGRQAATVSARHKFSKFECFHVSQNLIYAFFISIFSDAKIMQAERRGKRIHSFFLCRGAAYLIERYRKPSAEEKEFIHFSFAEAQLILSKDTASRVQKRQTCLSDYAKMQLFLYKDTATHAHPKRQAIKEIDIKAKYVKDKPIQTNNP